MGALGALGLLRIVEWLFPIRMQFVRIFSGFGQMMLLPPPPNVEWLRSTGKRKMRLHARAIVVEKHDTQSSPVEMSSSNAEFVAELF